MRAALAVMCLSFAAPATAQSFLLSGETPEQARKREARDMAYQRAETERYARFRPSDVAECRSRGNATFGGIGIKEAVMDDCLRARELRRQGR